MYKIPAPPFILAASILHAHVLGPTTSQRTSRRIAGQLVRTFWRRIPVPCAGSDNTFAVKYQCWVKLFLKPSRNTSCISKMIVLLNPFQPYRVLGPGFAQCMPPTSHCGRGNYVLPHALNNGKTSSHACLTNISAEV